MTSASSAGRITPALWTTVVTSKRLRHLARGLGGGGAVHQVDLDAVQLGMVDLAAAPRQRHHLVALRQQVRADRLADAGAAAGHGGDGMREIHGVAPTSASTRSGLPLPFSILSGGQISTAPVGGSRSRLLRHCRP